MNKHKIDFASMDFPQIVKYINGLRAELFGLNLSAATSHVKDHSQFKKLRKSIARALTYLHQKRQAML